MVTRAEPQLETTRREAEVGARLTAAFATVTVAAAVWPLAGWPVSLALLLIGLLAGIAAHRGGPVVVDTAVAPYILTVFCTLLADTLRFQIDYGQLLGGAVGGPLAHLGQRWWFVGFVVAPVTVMLLGGYVLGRGLPGAALAAWWTVLFAIVDGLTCLVLLVTGGPSSASLVAGAAGATAAQLLFATVLAQRLLARAAAPDVPEPRAGLTLRERNLWTALIVALVVAYALALWQQAGLLPVGVIVGSMMGGLIGWRKTTAGRPADPRFHVPLFLLMLALFYFHVGEEAITSFNRAIAGISGTPWADGPFTTLIGLAGPAVWVFAAWSLWHRQPFGNFVYWFLIVGMIIGEPTHLVVFPVMRMVEDGVGYGYFSGMYTALFPMIPAILAIRAIRRTHRQAPEERVLA
ncbi:MAG: hypothetical protein ACXVXU_16495 [Blastococcus sp.]